MYLCMYSYMGGCVYMYMKRQLKLKCISIIYIYIFKCIYTHAQTKHPLFFAPRTEKINTVDIFRLL